MSTTYQVRRGLHIVTTKDDAASALAFATVNAHFPGQLKVYAVVRDEYEITEPPREPIPFDGARTQRKRA